MTDPALTWGYRFGSGDPEEDGYVTCRDEQDARTRAARYPDRVVVRWNPTTQKFEDVS